MPLKLNSTGGGSVTLDTGSTASTFTLTLPSATGTVATTTGTLTNPTINGFTGDTSVINVGSGQLYKDTSGNVGVGTASPSSKITISGGSSTYAHINGGNSDTVPFLASVNDTNYATATYGWLWYNNATNGNLDLYRRNGSTSNTQVITFDRANGNLLVGATSSASIGARLQVVRSNDNAGGFICDTNNFPIVAWARSGGSNLVYFASGSGGTNVGTITTNGTGVTYGTASDYRLKNSVVPFDVGLETVTALKPVSYKWNFDDSYGEGFIAHELQEVIPLAVSGEKDAVEKDGKIKPQVVDYSKIVVHLVVAIQELSAKVAALEGK